MKKSCFTLFALIALSFSACAEGRTSEKEVHILPKEIKSSETQPCLGTPATLSGKAFTYSIKGHTGCCNSLSDQFSLIGSLYFGAACSNYFNGTGFLVLNGCQSDTFSLECGFSGGDYCDVSFATCSLTPTSPCFPVPESGYYSLKLALIKTATNQGEIDLVIAPQPELDCCSELFAAVQASGRAVFMGW